MSHLRDDVHISGHVANHEYWHHPPTMTHSSSPPNHINHHHPSSNPFYPPSMFQLHPQYLHHHPSSYEPYYYPNHYPSAESLAIESGSVCDLDQKPSLSSSVITPCTNYSSSPCSSSVVEPVTPIAALPPTSLPSSEMTQLRLSDQTLKSSPGSPLSHPTMHEQLGHQTTVNFHSTPCSGITSRPQAARSPFEWINTKKQPGVTQSMDGQTYPSSQPPPGNVFSRESFLILIFSLSCTSSENFHFRRTWWRAESGSFLRLLTPK